MAFFCGSVSPSGLVLLSLVSYQVWRETEALKQCWLQPVHSLKTAKILGEREIALPLAQRERLSCFWVDLFSLFSVLYNENEMPSSVLAIDQHHLLYLKAVEHL